MSAHPLPHPCPPAGRSRGSTAVHGTARSSSDHHLQQSRRAASAHRSSNQRATPTSPELLRPLPPHFMVETLRRSCVRRTLPMEILQCLPPKKTDPGPCSRTLDLPSSLFHGRPFSRFFHSPFQVLLGGPQGPRITYTAHSTTNQILRQVLSPVERRWTTIQL